MQPFAPSDLGFGSETNDLLLRLDQQKKGGWGGVAGGSEVDHSHKTSEECFIMRQFCLSVVILLNLFYLMFDGFANILKNIRYSIL